MYKVLFIDLDDTLWDTSSNGKESMEEVYQDYGFGRFFPTFDDFYSVYYPHNLGLWKKYREGKITKDELIFQRLAYPLQPFMECSQEFILSLNDDFLNRTTLKKKLLPHTIEVLNYLKPKYKMYILSNGFEEVQYQKMDNSGLTPYFKGVILSDNVGVNKPHPKIFEHAILQANCHPEEVLMIGDSWDADIEGAKNAGIDQCWLDLGIEQSDGFSPTYHITSLIELKEFL